VPTGAVVPQAIHAAHLIHRDLTLRNIMLATDARGRDRPKIIDFGLAKVRC
jgi:tRNA A-37 threonylcarbamoyl transferase component Bud32